MSILRDVTFVFLAVFSELPLLYKRGNFRNNKPRPHYISKKEYSEQGYPG